MLPAIRLSQFAVETANASSERIRLSVRITSPALTTACRQAGLPLGLAELCGGVLATVVDDLVEVGRLRKTDFERTKRKQRVLAAAEEPTRSALRIAVAASPVNGRAAVAHWDAICERHEIGKLAWLLGMETEAAIKYSRQVEKKA